MKCKLTLILAVLLFAGASYAYIIQGNASVPVLDGNIVNADTEARQQAMLSALKNYFSSLKQNQPDTEIPDVTPEFFKFIKSYKIADRSYKNDSVNYTILADVDDVALNDLRYFVHDVVNTAVYNLSGAGQDVDLDTRIADSFKEYKFDTKYQSDFQANLKDNSSEKEREDVFKNSPSQYFFEMSVTNEPAAEGECSVILTTRTFSKTKEFKTLKTSSTAKESDETECINTAVSLSFLKTMGYVRENFIPLPKSDKVLKSFNLTAENYGNFAVPKKLMEELMTRSFIDSYKIKSFAGNKLETEVKTYVDEELLLKKLQSIASDYGFTPKAVDDTNILLDFTQ